MVASKCSGIPCHCGNGTLHAHMHKYMSYLYRPLPGDLLCHDCQFARSLNPRTRHDDQHRAKGGGSTSGSGTRGRRKTAPSGGSVTSGRLAAARGRKKVADVGAKAIQELRGELAKALQSAIGSAEAECDAMGEGCLATFSFPVIEVSGFFAAAADGLPRRDSRCFFLP